MSVGGQAILEGVMMRSPHSLAIALRRHSGEIVVKEDAWHSIWEKAKFLRKPLLRGAVVLFESMHNGVKALTFSANEAAKFTEDTDGKLVQLDEGKAAPQSKATEWAIVGTILISVLFGFTLFAALPHFITWMMGVTTGSKALASGKDFGFQVVDGLIKISFLIGYLALISRMKDIQRVFQYHGAEHKSIYCYEDGKPLTVENARKYTTLHPRCGTSFLLITFVVSILLFSAVMPFLPEISSIKALNQLAYVAIKMPLMFPVAGIAYEATRLSAKFPNNPLVKAFTWPGLMLQHITTREPDDQQLEIALAALQMTLWRESRVQAGETQQGAQADAEPTVYGSFGEFETRLGPIAPVQVAA
jgi:uncharacterized protein YqhQ